MSNFLSSKFQNCRQNSSSYLLGHQKDTLQIITIYNDWVRDHLILQSVNTIKYKDSQTKESKKVLTILFYIRSSNHKNKLLCEIIFPPNFPKVPLIFSVKNDNSANLTILKKHEPHILPTGGYEIKIITHKYLIKPNELIKEFTMKVSSEWPLIPIEKNRKTKIKTPEFFNEKYNNIHTIFPFDFDFTEYFKFLENEKQSQQIRKN